MRKETFKKGKIDLDTFLFNQLQIQSDFIMVELLYQLF